MATTGSDSSSGTETFPWLTIQFAVDNVSPGDNINVKSGIYIELVTFHQSGNTDAYITLQNASGESPIIDATGLDGNLPGIIKLFDKNYIIIKGFEMRNLTSENWAAGVWCKGTSHHIEIRNNTIHDVVDPNPNGGCHGLAFYGTNSNAAMHDIIVDGNEIYDLKLKWSEACAINGNVTDFVVSNNVIHDVDNIAYVFIGFEGECGGCPNGDNLDRARNGHVFNNVAYNVDSKDNPPYNGERSADGFYVDGGRDIIFERNRSYQNNIGFEVTSEHQGKNAENVIVRNNFIYNNLVVGLATGGYANNVGATENCYFVNNSFFNNQTSTRPEDDWGAEILISFHAHNNVYENNIIYAASGHPRFLTVGTDNNGNTFNHNLYFGSTEGDAPGSNSIFADPLYTDPVNGDLHIVSSSPAINQGFNHPDSIIGETDFDNNIRIADGTVDIGAHEKDPSSNIIKPRNQLKSFRLYQNYPNPFNATTKLSYSITKRGLVSLVIYNMLGQEVLTLINEEQVPDRYSFIFNANGLASGVYLYQFKVGKTIVDTKKMIYMQ